MIRSNVCLAEDELSGHFVTQLFAAVLRLVDARCAKLRSIGLWEVQNVEFWDGLQVQIGVYAYTRIEGQVHQLCAKKIRHPPPNRG